MIDSCFVCGKDLTVLRTDAVTDDGQRPAVGPDCMKKIREAGVEGYPSGGIGPRLYYMPPEVRG